MAGRGGRHERTGRQDHGSGAGTPRRVAGQGERNEPSAMIVRMGACPPKLVVRMSERRRGMGRTGRMGALAAFGLCAALLPSSAGAQHAPAGEVMLTATSANVGEVGSPVKIHILRWSTDEERDPVIAALNPRPPAGLSAGLPAGAGRGAAGRGGRGRGARGGGGDAAPLTPMAALTAAIGK